MIVPILKMDDKFSCENYTEISLLSIGSKLLLGNIHRFLRENQVEIVLAKVSCCGTS